MTFMALSVYTLILGNITTCAISLISSLTQSTHLVDVPICLITQYPCVYTINDVIDVTVLDDAVCVPSYCCHGYT